MFILENQLKHTGLLYWITLLKIRTLNTRKRSIYNFKFYFK